MGGMRGRLGGEVLRNPGSSPRGPWLGLAYSGSQELWRLYLLQSHQGLGLGRGLLEAALGTEPTSLWVAAGNTKAVDFYKRLGFAPDAAEDRVVDWEDLHEIRMIRSC